MSEILIEKDPSDEKLREYIWLLSRDWDITPTEISRNISLSQGSLSKFLDRKTAHLTERPKAELLAIINDIVNSKPKKIAKYLFREPYFLDTNSTIRKAKEDLKDRDLTAGLILKDNFIKIVTLKQLDEAEEESHKSGKQLLVEDAAQEIVAVPALTSYVQLRSLVTGAGQEILVIFEPIKMSNRSFESTILGTISRNQVLLGRFDNLGNPAEGLKNRSKGYVKQHFPMKVAETLSQKVLSRLSKPRDQLKVLDVGTGPGNFAIAFGLRATEENPNTKIKIIGIEQNIDVFGEYFIENSKKSGLQNITELRMQGVQKELDLLINEGEVFDVIGFNLVLPWRSTLTDYSLKTSLDMRKPVLKLLKPQGYIAVSYYDKKTMDELTDIFEHLFNKHKRYFWAPAAPSLSNVDLLELLGEERGTVDAMPLAPEEITAESLQDGRSLFEYLFYALPSVYLSFLWCPESKRQTLRLEIIKALEEYLEKKNRGMKFWMNFALVMRL